MHYAFQIGCDSQINHQRADRTFVYDRPEENIEVNREKPANGEFEGRA